MTFFVISVLTLNIILWIVLLVRFKKLFSTDDIINQTQKKVEHLIREVDKSADRATYLAGETRKRIESMLEDADNKMELFREATQRLRDMIAEADRINKGGRPSVVRTIDPDSAYELSVKAKQPVQGNLFEASSNSDLENKTETVSSQKNVPVNEKPKTNSGYQEVPLIITKVYDDKPKQMSSEEKRKNRTTQVRRLIAEGASVEEIAQKLNCSITEIQFIIDMSV